MYDDITNLYHLVYLNWNEADITDRAIFRLDSCGVNDQETSIFRIYAMVD
ncbi:MAG: hypothetical protein HC879_02275 [Leptolyngbyaceae cyanobacterium SL_5_9]|nr:hypothetical protein [Leptolyngbyaceae cyanobacterium SL_5_9]NJO74458.1 hypothetical protein [Leptolyngbyaceae cyanobacterium RM1_406_9]